jgi:hypothetical protein
VRKQHHLGPSLRCNPLPVIEARVTSATGLADRPRSREVLRRLRNGGQQFVHVEHVHVNDGGQAIVGNVKKQDARGYMTIRKERTGFNLALFSLAALVLSPIRTRIWLFSWFPIRNCLTRDSYLNAPSSGSGEKWFYGR